MGRQRRIRRAAFVLACPKRGNGMREPAAADNRQRRLFSHLICGDSASTNQQGRRHLPAALYSSDSQGMRKNRFPFSQVICWHSSGEMPFTSASFSQIKATFRESFRVPRLGTGAM